MNPRFMLLSVALTVGACATGDAPDDIAESDAADDADDSDAPDRAAYWNSEFNSIAWAGDAGVRYDFTCPAGTTRAAAQVMDSWWEATPASIRLSLRRPGNAWAGISDGDQAAPGDFDENWSPWIYRAHGPGAYQVLINKVGGVNGWESYALTFECQNAAGNPVASPPDLASVHMEGHTAAGYVASPPAGGADVYSFTCPANTARAQGRIRSRGPGAVKLQLGKSGATAVSIDDPAAGSVSGWVDTAVEGAGAYRAWVTGLGVNQDARYQLEVRCLTAGGAASLPSFLAQITNSGLE